MAVYHIANLVGPSYETTPGKWADFIKWLSIQKSFQFDIETDVPVWDCERKLISLQFGSCTVDRVQWFIQRSAISAEQYREIVTYLENDKIIKLIHNAAFEYVTMRFYDCIIENVYDTMLAEKVLRGGMENDNYALLDLTWKYLRIIMDKSLQKEFGDDIINEAKVMYGVTDVMYLDYMRIQQVLEARTLNLLNVIALENDAVLAFSDISFEGMLLDKEKWRENLALATPVVAAAHEKVNTWLNVEPYKSYALKKGYIAAEDRIVLNLNSPAHKSDLLMLIFPDIPGASQPVIKKYIRDNGQKMDPQDLDILIAIQNKDYQPLIAKVVRDHKQFLVDKEYLIEAGKSTINWNSPDQVLPLVQTVEPKMKNLSAETVAKYTLPLLDDLNAYKDSLKLINTYGESFIEKHCAPDGKVRTHFNQVISTGRVSSSKPNMQNIPAKETVGTRYRNAFVCEPGWVFVDSDYSSQELVAIAYISKDPVWLACIARGEDLHSVCADLVYGKKWSEAAQSNCAYFYKVPNKEGAMGPKVKCDCKKHKSLRNGIKTINFGLAYGMSEIKLAATLKITRNEAFALISNYFRTFPAIQRTLTYLGEFGVKRGYIQTLAPFFRRRWFPEWYSWRSYIGVHLQGIKHVSVLGEIERASKNQPIQGCSADITKTAMVCIRDYIRENNLRDKVKLVAQVHDQITTICKQEFAEEWKPLLSMLMVEGGKLVIPTGILGCETTIFPTWTK